MTQPSLGIISLTVSWLLSGLQPGPVPLLEREVAARATLGEVHSQCSSITVPRTNQKRLPFRPSVGAVPRPNQKMLFSLLHLHFWRSQPIRRHCSDFSFTYSKKSRLCRSGRVPVCSVCKAGQMWGGGTVSLPWGLREPAQQPSMHSFPPPLPSPCCFSVGALQVFAVTPRTWRRPGDPPREQQGGTSSGTSVSSRTGDLSARNSKPHSQHTETVKSAHLRFYAPRSCGLPPVPAHPRHGGLCVLESDPVTKGPPTLHHPLPDTCFLIWPFPRGQASRDPIVRLSFLKSFPMASLLIVTASYVK